METHEFVLLALQAVGGEIHGKTKLQKWSTSSASSPANWTTSATAPTSTVRIPTKLPRP
jgi:hypothetical protein